MITMIRSASPTPLNCEEILSGVYRMQEISDGYATMALFDKSVWLSPIRASYFWCNFVHFDHAILYSTI